MDNEKYTQTQTVYRLHFCVGELRFIRGGKYDGYLFDFRSEAYNFLMDSGYSCEVVEDTSLGANHIKYFKEDPYYPTANKIGNETEPYYKIVEEPVYGMKLYHDWC